LSDTLIQIITISPTIFPSVSITASQTTICSGDSVLFIANPSNTWDSATYKWYINGTLTSTQSDTFISTSLTNSNSVFATLETNQVCASSLAISDTIQIATIQYPTADFMVDSFIADTYYFSNNSLNALTAQWDFGDGMSTQIANPNHIFQEEGTYHVCLTVSNQCDQDSICLQLPYFITSNKQNQKNNISLSPNPAATTLRIINKSSFVTLTDLTGKTLLTIPTKNKETEINISTLPSGIYFLRTNNDQTSKVIIQH
jgi:hypothetical protein